ncbi:hypothetical protein B0H63DRAFT_49324 [Podospora didyma]|uniref:Secreted protein n=1 Tax=Podospora didyma TaxID=330526 RepID=A0AAE0P717_9PEZI|nr:hypothetical protein B0H63DRAFT_49324 [Podospora didyma]
MASMMLIAIQAHIIHAHPATSSPHPSQHLVFPPRRAAGSHDDDEAGATLAGQKPECSLDCCLQSSGASLGWIAHRLKATARAVVKQNGRGPETKHTSIHPR